jgi:hypothetical protein
MRQTRPSQTGSSAQLFHGRSFDHSCDVARSRTTVLGIDLASVTIRRSMLQQAGHLHGNRLASDRTRRLFQ